MFSRINCQHERMGSRARIAALCAVFASSGITIVSSAVQAAQQPAPEVAVSQYSRLPDGKGKDTLIRVCGKCHSPMNVIANGQSREGWEAEVTKMAGLGASASDEEFSEILDYLEKNFPPVTAKLNINKASATEIETQLGLTTKQAQAIAAYRDKNGEFKTLDDIKKVPDLEAKEIDVRRNRITF